MHVMIDLETLGTRPGSAIAQIGAVLFEPVYGGKILNGKAFNQYIRPDDRVNFDTDTIAWWLQQSPDGRKRLAEGMSQGVTEAEALQELARWPMLTHNLTWEAVGGVWAHGPTFDVNLLHEAFARNGLEPAWSYRAPRDTRTLYFLANGGQPPEIDWTGFVKHDAKDDAIAQAMQVQIAMGMMR